jgi:hypothetical protein
MRRCLLVTSLVAALSLLVASQATAQVFVELFCNTDGATVYVDDEPVATTPLIDLLEIEPGEHTLRVSRPGWVDWEQDVVAEEGEDLFFDVTLLPFGGIVRVVSTIPGATVLLDGEEVGVTPYEGEVRIGEHDFVLQREFYEDWSATLTVGAGEEYLLEAEMTPLPDVGPEVVIVDTTPIYQEWWFWTGAAVLVGGGVAAAILLSEDEEAAPVDILIELP